MGGFRQHVSEFEIGIRRVRGSRLIDLVGRWEVGRVGQDRTHVWYYFELELFGKGEKTHEEHCVELKIGLAQLVEFRKMRRRVRERELMVVMVRTEATKRPREICC